MKNDKKFDQINNNIAESIKLTDPDDSVKLFLKLSSQTMHARTSAVYEIREDSYKRIFYHDPDGSGLLVDEIKLKDLPGRLGDAISNGMIVSAHGKIIDEDGFSSLLVWKDSAETFILCPIGIEQEFFGFIVFIDSDDMGHAGSDLYGIISNFISVLIRHRKMVSYLNDISDHDYLTGAYNLSGFNYLLNPLIRMIRQNPKAPKTDVIMFDIRNFKMYNKETGYYNGDRILIRMAEAIRKEAGTDRFCRSQADKFFLLASDFDSIRIIENVHNSIYELSDSMCEVRAGIYTLSGDEENPTQAVDRAEMACDSLYDNYFQISERYSPEMESDLEIRNYVIAHLEKAIEEKWIKVYYQPVVDTRNEKTAGFEALARWDDPIKGFLTPDVFIGPLEETHLTYKLDLFVLDQVCYDLKKMQDRGKPVCPVSINLSRNDLEIEGINDRINQILLKYDIDRNLIHIEITESALINNGDLIRKKINHFHNDGYQVWLDDFGSGYSSLNSLSDFDFDFVKLDQKFLRTKSGKMSSIVKDIINMVSHLDIATITEGVEKREQYDYLKDVGCMLVQGFYFSKPLPLEECYKELQNKGIGIEKYGSGFGDIIEVEL
jgi:diguanylate cyclase (GGDEF)-like protein